MHQQRQSSGLHKWESAQRRENKFKASCKTGKTMEKKKKKEKNAAHYWHPMRLNY